uniref:Uncharacterized protein n=1 Tax=Rhizophora mucronata TaxID=61149 RepID=A0A2P2QG98_RHIMU
MALYILLLGLHATSPTSLIPWTSHLCCSGILIILLKCGRG